jgi:hypothetical protein
MEALMLKRAYFISFTLKKSKSLLLVDPANHLFLKELKIRYISD